MAGAFGHFGQFYKDVLFISVLSNCSPGNVAFLSVSNCIRLSRKRSSVVKRGRFHEADTEKTKMNVLVKDAIVSISFNKYAKLRHETGWPNTGHRSRCFIIEI